MDSMTRRRFVGTAVAGSLSLALTNRGGMSSRRGAAPSRRPGAARPRPDLLDPKAPRGLEIIQLTDDPEVTGSHIYMEAQVFTPDSKRLIIQRAGHAHGSDRKEPRHQFLLCDLEDRCRIMPLTDEIGTAGPSVSPDGRYLYYFVDHTKMNGGRLLLKRVRLDGRERETLMAIDGPLPGTKFRPSKLYPLSTISSDEKRLAISACLGDGQTLPVPFGLMVFDLERPEVRLVIQGPTWINMHPQYCRSADARAMHDILIQENHDGVVDAEGKITKLVGGKGADIHVIRDDGSDLRDLPWGRDGNEFCQGHQCWRGRSEWAITSTQVQQPPHAGLIESLAVAHTGDNGSASPGGVRNHLSQSHPKPLFYHFATDIAGRRLVSDYEPFGVQGAVVLAQLGEAGKAPLSDYVVLAKPRPTGDKTTHMHPFLSPDGKTAFFNSDESGILQAYMVRGLG